jgi:hypothetical protein
MISFDSVTFQNYVEKNIKIKQKPYNAKGFGITVVGGQDVLLTSTAFIQVQTLGPEFHKTKYYIYICKCKKKYNTKFLQD